MEDPKPGTPAHFFNSVVRFLEVNNPGKAARVVVLIESETGEFWVQAMWENEIWVRGMIQTAWGIDNARIQLNVVESAERVAMKMREQELMATEVKGKAQ